MYECDKNINVINKGLKNFKVKLNTNSSFHDHNIRIKDLLRKPKGRLKLFDNTVLERGIEIWNSLYDSIKKSAMFLSFKNQLKSYMLNNK